MWFASKMRLYTVHIRPEAPHASEKPVFVREGFNIAAFLFAPLGLWALYQRLWFPALYLLLFYVCMVVLAKDHVLDARSIVVLQLGMQCFVGLQGNDWVRARLARTGYILADVSAADSLLRAEQRYFERYLAKA